MSWMMDHILISKCLQGAENNGFLKMQKKKQKKKNKHISHRLYYIPDVKTSYISHRLFHITDVKCTLTDVKNTYISHRLFHTTDVKKDFSHRSQNRCEKSWTYDITFHIGFETD